MKNKIVFINLITVGTTAVVLLCIHLLLAVFPPLQLQTNTVAVKTIESQISALGTIHSQNEATLHFQTAGKVVYLPYKIGDKVYQGATIAQLDTYALQRQLSAALNTYRSTRDTFDQTQANNQNGNLQSQQKYNLDYYTPSAVNNTDVINSIVKRVLDQSQATLDNSVINVELANYALQLATLTSPINGVITAEDITTPNVNVTPLITFSIADPTAPLFKAHVAASDIDYVNVGAQVTIQLNGLNQSLHGVVTQVEPQKLTDTSGDYYIVDIESSQLQKYGKLGQTGNVLINNTLSGQHLLIPTWTILNHSYVWVLDNNHPMLKKIVIGQTHGDNTEILDGLKSNEQIITNPQQLAKTNYSIL